VAPSDLLSQSTPRALTQLAWPLIVLGLLRTSTLLVDSWFVGWLGTQALAGIAGATFAMWILAMLAEIPGTGAQTLTSQAVGAQSTDRIRSIAAQSLWMALLVALFVLGLRPLMGLYFQALGATGPVGDLGAAYIDASMLGGITFTAQAALVGVFRGLGDMRTAVLITAVALIANAIIDPVFIFTLEMGIAGAAWATVAANALATGLGAWLLARRGHAPGPWRPRRQTLGWIAQIGIPIAVQGTAFSLVYVALGRVLMPFGDAYLAALGLGHRLESLLYLFCLAFEIGVATLVGQHLGAGNPEGAKQAANAAARFAALAMLPLGVAMFFGARTALGWFTDDPVIIDAGELYLRTQAFVAWAMAAECVYTGAFSGSGNTLPPLAIGGTLSALRIPAAIALGVPFGAHGVWIAIALSTLAKGVVLSAWWARHTPQAMVARDTVAQ
jgi:putative MATE family efflux protein